MNKHQKLALERGFRHVPHNASYEAIMSAVMAFCESYNTPKSLGIWLRLKYDPRSYLEIELNPSDFVSAYDYMNINFLMNVLKKSNAFKGLFDPRKEAMQKFIECELECAKTNDRFLFSESCAFRTDAERWIFHSAKRKISKIMGPAPSLSDLPLAFGPGNNVGQKRLTDAFYKLKAVPTVTKHLLSSAPIILGSSPSWAHLAARTATVPSTSASVFVDVNVVGGSELGFVPKTAKTDRPICTEPLLNSFLQLGIGKYLRGRLRKVGIDLNDQSRNQSLAREGSISGDLATIDLSSASDMISFSIVYELLPSDWFELMDKARSHFYSYEGKSYSFEKFSSMGNGFTFELETLIFYALTVATCEFHNVAATVSVYGDDIIAPSKCYRAICDILHFAGFQVNEKKSFHTGPFRESCGEDYFLGAPVRALYMKGEPTVEKLMAWCNWIFDKDLLLDPNFKSFYTALKRMIPKEYYILKGPSDQGHGHFHSKPPRKRGSHRYLRRGYEGSGFYTLESVPILTPIDTWLVYSAALYRFSQEKFSDRYLVGRRNYTATRLKRRLSLWQT
jgi:hypothetical protein